MISFQVNDMTCGHCVSSITKAVKALDGGAKVQIDLAAHRVEIEAAGANAVELSDAIKEAGYTPVPVENSAVAPIVATAAPTRKGCCCG
ncbi:MAG: heavy-metal-associated domain-containing protein [Burkholderiales bacterium]|nr:heavy-metal-associated domain-containing protein [Burkholderiales bacterium]